MRDLVNPGAVVARLDAANKKEVLQGLAHHAAAQAALTEQAVFDVLWERERLGTTGVGLGIAIPHGRLDGLMEVMGFFARLTLPVPFDAIDDQPVDLVFLLLSPESAGADHLYALASVARLLRNASLCEALRAAQDDQEIYRHLTATPQAQAA